MNNFIRRVVSTEVPKFFVVSSQKRQSIEDLALAEEEFDKSAESTSLPLHSKLMLNAVKMRPLSLRISRPSRQEHPSIERLAKQRRFDEITDILQFKGPAALSSWLGISRNSKLETEDEITWVEPTSSSALHLIMRHCPPVAVVDILIQKMTEIKRGYMPEAAVDELGRTALHIAVESGCDISVIKRLTASSELPAITMDSYGRFPLHWGACSASTRRGRSMKNNAVDTVSHLVELYPHAAIVPDSSGKTPWDLAVDKGADKRIALSLIMVQQIIRKSAPGSVERTASTAEFSAVPRVVAHARDESDDLSSVGSRGASRPRRRCSRRVAI